MPQTDDNQFRFATNVFDTDGTDRVYDLSFALGYLDSSSVLAMSGVEDPETKLLTNVLYHTVNFTDVPAGTRVTVFPIPAAGRKLILFRQTDIADLLVKFQDGKLQTGRNMDLSATQLIMAIQEILDGLRENNVIVERQVNNVVDISKLVQEIYQEVIQLLASGGIVSVAPRVWQGEWAGDTVDDTDFPIIGADVSDPGFYDTYVNGQGINPVTDFEIILTDNPADAKIRFANVPEPGSTWFTVLRGYARPYTGPDPITKPQLRTKIVESDGPVFNTGYSSEFALVRCNDITGTEVRVQSIPAVAPEDAKLGSGSYMSFVQKGGPVTVVAGADVVLNVPAGCLPRTRAVNSVVSITCEFADGNEWLLSGDLAKEE